MKIKKYITDWAAEVARTSPVVRGKIGAILFTKSGQIIEFACNKTIWGDKDCFTLHAEENLLTKMYKIKAIKRNGDRTLNILIVRWKASINGFGNAKPCIRCEYLLRALGLKVFYSNELGKIIKLK